MIRAAATGRRTGHARRLAVLAAVLVAGAVAAWPALRTPRPTRQAVTLTNGVVLVLEDVTFGRRHQDPLHPSLQGWERLAINVPDAVWDALPAALQSRRIRTPYAGQDILVVWLATGGAPRFTPVANPVRYTVEVSDGPGEPCAEMGFQSNGGLPDGRDYEAHYFPVFPRRARELEVRVHDGSPKPHGSQPVHTFRIANPAATGTPRPAQPSPFPATVRSQGLEVTVEALNPETVFVGTLIQHPARPPGHDQSAARVTFRERGQPVAGWKVLRVGRVHDSTGNSGFAFAQGRPLPLGLGEDLLLQHPIMPRGESLRAVLEVGRPGAVDTNQVCRFRGVGVAAGQASATTPDGRRRIDIKVSRSRWSGLPGPWELEVLPTSTSDGHRAFRWMLVDVVDARTGRPIPLPADRIALPLADWDPTARLELPLPAGVTNVDLTMAVVPVRTLDVPWPNPAPSGALPR